MGAGFALVLSSVRHRKLKELVLDLDVALTLPQDQRLVINDALHRLRAGPRRKGRKVRGRSMLPSCAFLVDADTIT